MTPEDFRSPSPEFGPVPFWWWVGEPVTRERLAWQLDRLKEKGVLNAIVSYNHHADGSPNTGEPAVFSPEWWDLFRGVLDDCKARGMRLSFQDYTLLNPLLQEIGAATPGMSGAGTLGEVHWRGAGGGSVRLEAADDPLGAWAFPVRGGRADAGGGVDLRDVLRGRTLEWAAPEGEWLVSLVSVRPNPFDPMHPESGKRVIERFYAMFDREIAGHLGTTFPVSFQDELDFGSPMPRWSRVLPGEFAVRKGYALAPVLPALWHDLGPLSPKVRIDYADAVVSLMEERYFIPVFEWHEARGLLFANDNLGRGGIASGCSAYGDTFRTMRWYSAPGTDDPNLAGARAFKGLKVNSSIAHLYGRPRVWNEAFHSSGWGTTPGAVIAALNEDFIHGATVVNLHGLYYSTFGSWWEWAPPDFHFRQPYWNHTAALSGYATRLCQALAAGVHVCDVAVLYPVTALEGGLNPRVDPETGHEVPVSERQAGQGGGTLDAAEAAAFGIGRALVDAGVDFDFVDYQSLERAAVRDGGVHVSGETYRALVLPWMSALRFSTLRIAAEFARCGGTVIAFGCLPAASERAGMGDAEVDALTRELFGGGKRGMFIPDGHDNVVGAITAAIGRDFDPCGSGLMAVHRRGAERDLYFVFNPGERAVEADVGFRAAGHASVWDAWTGGITAVPAGASRLNLVLEPGEAKLVVFSRAQNDAARPEPAGAVGLNRPDVASVCSGGGPLGPTGPTGNGAIVMDLAGPWEFTLEPTMDNRFGDFRLPADEALIGPEARRFRCRAGDGGRWDAPDFDDAAWTTVTASFGPRLWKLGPLPADAQLPALPGATRIDPSTPVIVNGQSFHWSACEFSLRWGIENDPYLTDWAAGPHGLKGVVPDDFIDLHCAEPGAQWLLWTSVVPAAPGPVTFVMGSRSRYAAWINGRPVLSQDEELPPGRQSQWNLPHYQSTPRACVVDLRAGPNPMLLRFVQPAGQRVRAYAAFDMKSSAPTPALALRWFAQPGHPVFDCQPGAEPLPLWFRFTAPPALRAFTVVSCSAVRAWNDGNEAAIDRRRLRPDGLHETRFVIKSPSRRTSLVALRADPASGFHGGDVLPEPVRLECGAGEMPCGDWSDHGLATYSGSAWYRKTIVLTPGQAARAVHLDLGRVAATAGVRINGRPAATLLAAPWRVPVAGLLHDGGNLLEIQVANTLANHFSVGIPTPYVFSGQTVSGLLGPVSLKLRDPSCRP